MALDPITASLLVGGGSSLIGGLLGRGEARRSAAAQRRIAAAIERAQQLQEEMIRKYEGIADPFREELYPNILSILSGETDISTNPMYSIARLPLEQQYSQARRMLESRPGGTGTSTRALGELEATRASEVGGIPSRLYQALLGTGLGIASGKPELAVQGYGDIARTNAPMLDVYQRGVDTGTNIMAGSGEMLGQTIFNLFNRPQPPSTVGNLYLPGYGMPPWRPYGQ